MQEIKADAIDKDKLEIISKLITAINANVAEQSEKYMLTFDDVKKLHGKYLPLQKDIKSTEKQAGGIYVNAIEGCLISALKHEARKISDVRDIEYKDEKAELEAKSKARTPKSYFPWYWIFLPWCWFKKKPNRAMQILIDKEELAADELHDRQEHENALQEIELDKLEERLDLELRAAKGLPPKSKKMSDRKLKRQRKAYEKLRKIFEAADNASPGDAFEDPQDPTPAALPEPGLPEREEIPPLPTEPPAARARKQAAAVVEQLPGQIDIEEIGSPDPKTETGDKNS